LNPSVAATLSITVQHNLLQGFGIAVNSRNIRVAKLNRKISDIDFQTQVMSIVSSVLRAYYTLVGNDEDFARNRRRLPRRRNSSGKPSAAWNWAASRRSKS